MTAWIISSSVLIAVIAAARCLLKGKISPRMQYLLWLPVLLRLLLPVSFGESSASVMNYIPEQNAVRWEEAQASRAEAPQNQREPEERESAAAPQPAEGIASDKPDRPISGAVRQPGEPIPAQKPDRTALLQAVWIAGGGVVLLCVLGSNLRFYGKIRRSRQRRGTYRGLPVYECGWLETPCMFGLFRPAIYLSPGISELQREHVLAHEYGHCRQGDHIWALLRGLCLALHWYNPMVWLAARLSKRDGELACDERVTHDLDSRERICYGQTLISLSCAARAPIFCTATTMSGKGRELKERVEYIAKQPRMMVWALVVILVVTAFAAGCTFTGAKSEQQPEDPAPTAAAAEPTPEATVMPEASLTPALSAGVLLDRNGQRLDPSLYPGLEGAEETFRADLAQGNSVGLTIDLALQQQGQEILEEYLDRSAGAAVIVDVNTGAPLALLSNGREENHALQSAYQPRNLFLPCTGIAVLSEYILPVDYEIPCEGVFDRYEAEGYAPECWIWNAVDGEHNCHGEENMAEALRDSCYYYFYSAGNELGIDNLEEYGKKLGLGQPTGIELPETTGTLASRRTPLGTGREWRIGDTLEAAVGRSVNAFTPLQLAEYCAVIANRGTRYSASVLNTIQDTDGELLYTRQSVVLNPVPDKKQWQPAEFMTDSWWEAIHRGMYEAMNDYEYNDAYVWRESPWKVAGLSHSSYGLFMGFAPYDDPQVAICVVVEEERNASLVGEIARDILNAYIQLELT